MLVVTDLFKGATRPACLWGIPYKPAIFTFLFFMLLAAWTWMPLILLSAPALYAMRLLTKKDDQIFRQLAVWLRTEVKANGNRDYWSGWGVTSISALNCSKEKRISCLIR